MEFPSKRHGPHMDDRCFFVECIVKLHLDVRLSSDMIGIFETEKMFFSLVTSQHGCHRSGLVVIDRKSMG